MIYIGLWASSIYDQALVFPQELPTASDLETQQKIVRYLRAGTIHAVYRGYEHCRFHCGIANEEMGNTDLTDGVWAWPSGLAHYVSTHKIILPDDFVKHALGHSVRSSMHNIASGDEYWSGWSRQQRNQASCQLIDRLRDKCDADITKVANDYFREITLTAGVSDIQCTWKGCSSLALKDRVLCARHLTEVRNDASVNLPIHELQARYTAEFLRLL